jgi:hypothetical protein
MKTKVRWLVKWFKDQVSTMGWIGLFLLLYSGIPDIEFWRHSPIFAFLFGHWRISFIVIGLVLIWVDAQRIAKRHGKDPNSLSQRALRTCEELEQLKLDLGPEPELVYTSNMGQEAFNEKNHLLQARERKMFHIVKRKFSTPLFDLYHEFGEEGLEEEALIAAVNGRVETDQQLNAVIDSLRKMAFGLEQQRARKTSGRAASHDSGGDT